MTLGFTRPYLTSKASRSLSFAPSRSILILLDNSFSMRFGDHFHTAKRIAGEVIDGMKENDRLQIAEFSDTLKVSNPPSSDSSQLKRILSGIHPGYGKTDYISALRSSCEILSGPSNLKKEIHLISDFQETGWFGSGDLGIDESIQLIPHNVSATPIFNRSMHFPRYEPDSLNEPRFLVQVAASGKSDTNSARVILRLNGKLLQEKPIMLKPGGVQVVEFTRVSVPSDAETGEFSISPHDLLPDDDHCYFSIGKEKPYRILLITDRTTRDIFYFRNALTAGKDSPFHIEVVRPDRFATREWSPYAAVVLNDLSVVPAGFTSAAMLYLQQGGSLWTVVSEGSTLDSLNSSMSEILPATAIRKQTSIESKREWHIGTVDGSHRVFEIFNANHLAQFRSLLFSGRVECIPKAGSRVLASFDDGTAFLVEKKVGKGFSLLYCSSVSPEWNDLPLHPVFVSLVQQIARYLVNYNDTKMAYWVGDSIPLELLNPRLSREINRVSLLSKSFLQNWKIISPSGKPITLKDENLNSNTFVSMEEPGFYKTNVENVDSIVAVNTDPAESNLESFDPVERIRLLGRTNGVSSSSTPASPLNRNESLSAESQTGIWGTLYAIAIAVFVIESYLSNRYYGDKIPLKSRQLDPSRNHAA